MSELKVIPLGGVAEIGSNMTLFAKGKKAIIVDCGILFPYENFFSINYLIPDFSLLDKYEITEIIFTHGHEDHIGAVAHIIEKLPHVVIRATKFCSELIRTKLEYLKISHPISVFDTNSILKFDDMEIHPIHVNHSIPETTGMLFRDKDKSLLFISDFKVDLDSPYEKPLDIEKIKTLQEKTTKNILMLDSTNILNDGKTTGERELIRNIELEISKLKNRVYVTLFSSNIHRLITIFEAAKKHKRKIGISGRSIHKYIEAAIKAGIINESDYNLLDEDQIDKKDKNVLIIISGCQGDFRSSLRRLAEGNHSKLLLEKDDAVLFSSKVIPGNEKQVYQIYNKLIEKGVQIITSKDSLIHASGHPGKKDLEYLISNIKCTDYIPIHGESYFLEKHIEFIKSSFPEVSTYFVLNGNEILINKKVKIKDTQINIPKIIHSNLLELERTKISERRKISENGLCLISISGDTPLFEMKGLPTALESHLEKFKKIISNEIKKMKKEKNRNEQIRILARRNFQSILGYKPITIVIDHD